LSAKTCTRILDLSSLASFVLTIFPGVSIILRLIRAAPFIAGPPCQFSAFESIRKFLTFVRDKKEWCNLFAEKERSLVSYFLYLSLHE
jgi:hypothetical protein